MSNRVLEKKIVSVLVRNQINVLARLVNLFGRRGFSIDALATSVTENEDYTRITIVFNATEEAMQQIITQTEKLEVVESVTVMEKTNSLYRELMLLKVKAGPAERTGIKEIVDIYRGKIVDLSKDSLIIELTGTPEKIAGFLEVMSDYEVLDICRTGVTGMEIPAPRDDKQPAEGFDRKTEREKEID